MKTRIIIEKTCIDFEGIIFVINLVEKKFSNLSFGGKSTKLMTGNRQGKFYDRRQEK